MPCQIDIQSLEAIQFATCEGCVMTTLLITHYARLQIATDTQIETHPEPVTGLLVLSHIWHANRSYAKFVKN